MISHECFYVEYLKRRNTEDNSVAPLDLGEVQNTFFSYYEYYLNELKDGRVSGRFDENDYQNRLQGLNKAYDNLLCRYAFRDAANGFHSYELWLNDIKTRYSNGDFGEGDNVYEERLAAWNKSFAGMISSTQQYVRYRLGGLSKGLYEKYFGDNPSRMYESSLILSDIETMMNNVREYILSGGSAAYIPDEIFNKGCKYATVDDFNYLMSKELWDMERELRKAYNLYVSTPFDLEPDKKVIEDTCANLIERIKLNEKIGDTLKKALIQRLSFVSEYFPILFRNTETTTFIPYNIDNIYRGLTTK